MRNATVVRPTTMTLDRLVAEHVSVLWVAAATTDRSVAQLPECASVKKMSRARTVTSANQDFSR